MACGEVIVCAKALRVQASSINKKATAVVVHPPTPGYEFLRKAPEFLGFQLCKRPDLAVSSQPIGVIGRRQEPLPHSLDLLSQMTHFPLATSFR